MSSLSGKAYAYTTVNNSLQPPFTTAAYNYRLQPLVSPTLRALRHSAAPTGQLSRAPSAAGHGPMVRLCKIYQTSSLCSRLETTLCSLLWSPDFVAALRLHAVLLWSLAFVAAWRPHSVLLEPGLCSRLEPELCSRLEPGV